MGLQQELIVGGQIIYKLNFFRSLMRGLKHPQIQDLSSTRTANKNETTSS